MDNVDDLLSFKEFPPVHGQTSPPRAQININSPTRINFGNKDPLDELIDDMSKSAQAIKIENMDNQGPSPPPMGTGDETPLEGDQQTRSSPVTLEFYQKYFNVDTITVVERIINSILPRKAPPDYLKSYIGKNPDLYGPFWISATLIFLIAIAGNISDYIQTHSPYYEWKYNFRMVSYAATVIYIYTSCIPIALWAAFKWSLKPNEDNLDIDSANYTPSLLSLMCIYGYSLAIYIPVSILWLIQYWLVQWILVIGAAFTSGIILIVVLTPALRNSKFSLFIMLGILATHFLLATGFMLYFFHSSSPSITVDVLPKVTEMKEHVNATH